MRTLRTPVTSPHMDSRFAFSRARFLSVQRANSRAYWPDVSRCAVVAAAVMMAA